MQCYDCSKRGVQREAVGLCHHCSAGLCAEHAIATDEPVLALSINRTVVLPLHSRKPLCALCTEALEQPRVERMEKTK